MSALATRGRIAAKVLLKRFQLDGADAEQKEHIFQVGLKAARELAQCDTVRIEEIDLQEAKPSDQPMSLVGERRQRHEFRQRDFFQVEV